MSIFWLLYKIGYLIYFSSSVCWSGYKKHTCTYRYRNINFSSVISDIFFIIFHNDSLMNIHSINRLSACLSVRLQNYATVFTLIFFLFWMSNPCFPTKLKNSGMRNISLQCSGCKKYRSIFQV